MSIGLLCLQLAVILLACRVAGRLLRAVGVPAVVAEIGVGIALGPTVFGFWWPGFYGALFPAASLRGLDLVAELGLVFFMFLVGLEFDPKLVRGNMSVSARISAAGVILPFALGVAVAGPLHSRYAPDGVQWLPFALFLGVAMSVTAFPVLARLLAEHHLTRTRVGSVALAAAAVGDVAAWCMLAGAVGIATSGSPIDAALTTAGVLIYTAFVWGIVRPVLRRIGPRGGHKVSTDVVAFIYLSVALSAAATDIMGVHSLFGAFLIGAAMPREGGVSQAVVERTEDFVTLVLLPLFFAASGLRTELRSLQAEDLNAFLGILALATVGKFGGTWLAARGFSLRERATLGVLMNTRGLMEIVVLNVGLQLGLLDVRLFAILVMMAIVTTLATPMALFFLAPSRRGADDHQRSGGLLVCLSDPSLAGSLIRLARNRSDGLREALHAVHLRPTERPQDYLRDDRTEDDEPLRAVARAAAKLNLQMTPHSWPSASPGSEIVALTGTLGTDLLVVGVHRSTLGWDTLGGVAGRVLRDAPCDVAVLVDRGVGDLRRIAVKVGTGAHAIAARRVAETLAQGGAEIVTDGADLTVTDYEPGRSWDAGSWLLVRGRRA